MIVGLCHKKRVGKDVVADYLVNNYGFKKVAFADGIREASKVIYGLTEEQMLSGDLKEVPIKLWGKSPRELLTGTGEALKVVDPKIWVKNTRRKIEEHIKQGHGVVISDVRFFIEVDEVKNMGGYLWKINRPYVFYQQYSGLERLQYKLFGKLIHTDKHISETQLDTFGDYDAVLKNDIEGDLRNLYSQVDCLMNCCCG